MDLYAIINDFNEYLVDIGGGGGGNSDANNDILFNSVAADKMINVNDLAIILLESRMMGLTMRSENLKP
jgi:hypothetical protein